MRYGGRTCWSAEARSLRMQRWGLRRRSGEPSVSGAATRPASVPMGGGGGTHRRQSWAARSSAACRADPAGTTRDASPMRSASGASTLRPVTAARESARISVRSQRPGAAGGETAHGRMRSMALACPMRRGRRTVPPSIRGTPHRRQKTPSVAFSSTTRRSHHSASSSPPATAQAQRRATPSLGAQRTRHGVARHCSNDRLGQIHSRRAHGPVAVQIEAIHAGTASCHGVEVRPGAKRAIVPPKDRNLGRAVRRQGDPSVGTGVGVLAVPPTLATSSRSNSWNAAAFPVPRQRE